jgi:nicotinamidase-related amidase
VNSAVLVIDVQQALCEPPLEAHDCAGTIARINAVTRKARAAAVPVIFVQHEAAGTTLEHGAAGWELARGLEQHPGDPRVRKTTPDAFLRTSLEALLDAQAIRSLVVCGMHSEFCVDTTVRQALARGYPVTLVEDAHTSAGNSALDARQVIAHENATLSSIQSFGPRVTLVAAAELAFAPP